MIDKLDRIKQDINIIKGIYPEALVVGSVYQLQHKGKTIKEATLDLVSPSNKFNPLSFYTFIYPNSKTMTKVVLRKDLYGDKWVVLK